MLRSLLVALWVAAPVATTLAKDSQPAKYAFNKPPLAIHDALAELKVAEVPALPADERKLLETIWQWRTEKKSAADARPDQTAVIDAMLWASGVDQAAAREKYRREFEKVVTAARAAAKDAKNDRERGERLMKVLHSGVMKKGYSLDQTSFAAVFDGGEFNCVSSTAMYLLTGEQLGLKLVPISIPGMPFVPGHAALDMLDGAARVQIEPTNPDGFDWGTKSKRPGVIIIGYVPDRTKGHETDALGIAASIYTNRGVALNKEEPPQRLAAIRCDLAALALDPTDGTATNNLISAFVNWGPALAKAEQFAEAVRVLSFGRGLGAMSRELDGNLTATYEAYIDDRLAKAKDQEALTLIAEASQDLPTDREFKSPAHWFERRAGRERDEEGWEAGLAVIGRGLAIVPEKEKKELAKARTSHFRQWSQELLEKGDIGGSVKVLARGFAIDRKDEALHDGIGYHTSQALALLDKSADGSLAEHFQLLVKEFPGVKDVEEAGFSIGAQAIQKLADAGKFAEGLKAAERYKPLAARGEKQAELGALPYDLWARDLAEKKKWQEAYDKYAAGLKAYPKERRLVQNLAATIVDWAEPEMDARRWDEAIRIYDLGLALLPEYAVLKLNREFCVEKKAGK
ncbi:MAG: hypothetical protein L0211_02690 [Planctomycetaceae bacterium]|nr:hypothetical protein [Planctomycetaceae bacterium]